MTSNMLNRRCDSRRSGFPISAKPIVQEAQGIASCARITAAGHTRLPLVETKGVAAGCPFSGVKLSPVLTVYRAANFAQAVARVHEMYA
jgi:sulfoacetaldehyde dehydrogenase